MNLADTGKWLVMAGLALVVLGGLAWAAGRIGLPFGNLPGDIRVDRGNFSFRFPIATCIIASIVLTLLLNLILRWFGR